ncbi:ELWxxDGT repeat protein [Maribacter aurantiacus]|uniref:T9SS type A sorting domain-containing protein n=1 Tax=Maribacter aurantiacus TaxID=1882343 RepID=A0A5R8M9Z6_9FLAO|nr:ELWxxDGT repeat protein [Maribacter aurantiacus]TLF45559.1 T9SS type A sorting domain-containing protein [Maribacter aurantiacus]
MLKTVKKIHINLCLIIVILIGQSAQSQTYLENFYEIRNEFVTLNGNSFFFASSTSGKQGLWRTDGTQKGTYLVSSFSVDEYNVGQITVYNNALYFAARDQEAGLELWKSDGTPAGTNLLMDINTGNSSSWPSNFTIYDGKLYFTASDQYTSGRKKLFRTDGTVEGTGLAMEIFDADAYEQVSSLTVANGKLYFVRSGVLYETNGTQEGTKSTVVDGLSYNVSSFHAFADGIYFTTDNHNKTYVRLYRLTDLDNYTMLKEFSTESHYGLELYGLTEVGDKVIFSLVSGETYTNVQDALWTTDGTPEGTIELMTQGGDDDLWFEPHFSGFVEYNGEVYFNAGPKTNGALWKTNGTIQGTTQIIANAYIRDEAPMIILDDMLYYMGANSLFEFDFQKIENSSIWPFQLYRKSTGDKFFIKSDGKFVYAAVKNERQKDTYNMDLFHTGPNPIIKVKAPWDIFNGQSLRFDTKIDSLVKKEINIQNFGNAPLAFSQVFVSGEGFYINGDVEVDWYQQESQTSFPRQIGSTERGIFEIGFLPGMEGVYSGYLIIRSNDTSQPEFRVKLEGYASEAPPESVNATFPTEKEIKWENLEAQFNLDNNLVSENATSGTVIGKFMSVSEPGNFNYQIVQGSGSSDNPVFEINNDQLLVGGEFQANNKKSYTIRVKATDSDGGEYEESIVIEVEEESIEVQLEVCEQIAVSMTSDLYDIDFLNDTDAIAVGAQGIILKTTDKGSTWEQLHIIERTSQNLLNADLHDVQFVDGNVGFVLGSNTLLRTDDAGVSWKPLKIENLNSYRNAKLWAISSNVLFLFVNNYRSGNTLYISNDGGRTWDNSSFTGFRDMVSLYFYDDTFGLISDSSEGYYITNDGGQSWTRYEPEVDELSYNEDITGFSFIDVKVGYASTQNGKVLKTEDGGLSWSLINSDYRNSISQIHFIDEDNGYLVDGSLYETTDGGLNWNKATMGNCVDIKSVSFNNLGDNIAVGTGCYTENGRSIYTASSSSSWNEVSALNGTREIREVIIDGQEVYLFSSSQSRKSFDGGITWKEFNTPLGRDLYYADKIGDVIYIKGANGSFYKSTDDGLNWNKLGSNESLSKFDIMDEDIIFAFGSINGGAFNIYKTNDGGLTWNPLDSTPGQRNVLDFFDENLGFVGGIPGISRTKDGGLSWEELTINPELNLYVYGMAFGSDQVGIISTNEGFYKTENGGDTWFEIPLNVPYTGTIIPVNELEWFIKSQSNIYRTNDGGETWEVYFNAQYGITGLYYFEGSLYFSDNNGGVSRIMQDPQPLNAGYINGDLSVRVGDQEIYSVVKHADNKYTWSVSGGNKLVSEGHFARVTWQTPGEYVLEVTPYATCETGTAAQITVNVYGQMAPPDINGPLEVLENSKEIEYTTSQEDQVSYIWSVTGQQSFQVEGNTLIVDWGAIGQQEIGLIKTDLLSGIRTYNNIKVDVLPLDPFTILQTNASCRETANGSLQITSRMPSISYRATLLANGNESSIEFTDEILFDNLGAGIYDLCIEDIESGKEHCYQFTIAEPEPFEVSSKTGSISSKEVNLKFNGGLPPYTVFLNGHQIAKTSQSTLSFKAERGDTVEVLSSGTCSLSHIEEIHFSGEVEVSPNPVENSFTVFLGDDFPVDKLEISVRIFSSGGQLVSQFNTRLSNHTIRCDVSTLPSGIYFIQVGDDETTSFKIIKK